MKTKVCPYITLVLLLAATTSLAGPLTVEEITGNVRFSNFGGDQLQIGVHDSFDEGVTIRTYRDSSVTFTGNGYTYRLFSSSLLRVESEPDLKYGKISRSPDGRFIDLHFYFIPSPAQGRTVKVIASSDDENIEMRAALLNAQSGTRELAMYEIKEGTFRALAGFDCEAPAVRYQLHIAASGENAGYTKVIFPFYLRKTPFSSGSLELSGAKAPLFENSQQRQQEVRYLSQILATPSPLSQWEGTFTTPLESPEVISAYGRKRSYFMNGKRIRIQHHRGVDYRADFGTPVYAPNYGVVVLARDRITTGYTLVIDHGQGVFSLFFHLQGFTVAEGDKVRKGDRIAETGATGIAAGPHLHWGMFVNGFYVDPEEWVKRRF
jgi:murein DD-endopeptidase MepM/ murein hydrolase activator NlpD